MRVIDPDTVFFDLLFFLLFAACAGRMFHEPSAQCHHVYGIFRSTNDRDAEGMKQAAGRPGARIHRHFHPVVPRAHHLHKPGLGC